MNDKTQRALPEATNARRRGPGRPQSSESSNINRASIFKKALALSTKIPLQDLSVVTVAKAMNVTPALIHYYIGGRDWLTSGVMNLFYKELLKKWPVMTGDWHVDLEAAATLINDRFAHYGGIAAYAVSNSKFRVFQLVAEGDRDYGVEVLERFAGCVRAAGLPGPRTGIYTNQLLEFLIANGHATARHMFPSNHRQFLQEKSGALDPEKYPNIFFAEQAPINIDGKLAFREGLYRFILAMETEAARPSA